MGIRKPLSIWPFGFPWKLLLSVGGEFPSSSLGILGNERVYKQLVHRLESVQDIRSSTDILIHTSKLVNVNGKRDKRTIRLYKGALPVLNAIHPHALKYYLNSFEEHKFHALHPIRWNRYCSAASSALEVLHKIIAMRLSTLRNPKLRLMMDLMTLFVASSFPVDIPYLSVATMNLRLRSIFPASFSNSGIPHFLAHLSQRPSARQAALKVSCLNTSRKRSFPKYAA